MQFIETSSFGVRAAVYHLQRADSPLEFVLFPMIHVGSRDYYATVRSKLSECDYILAEGVSSRHASLLALSYRVIGKIKQRDLVTQDCLDTGSLSTKVLHADLTGSEFEREWGRIPLRVRMGLYLLLPLCTIYLLIFGTKKSVARHLEFDDLPSREEVLYSNNELIRKVDELVVHYRDAKLIHQLEALQGEHGRSRKVVGIVYGAAHMREIVRYLIHESKYHVSKSEWLAVFEY